VLDYAAVLLCSAVQCCAGLSCIAVVSCAAVLLLYCWVGFSVVIDVVLIVFVGCSWSLLLLVKLLLLKLWLLWLDCGCCWCLSVVGFVVGGVGGVGGGIGGIGGLGCIAGVVGVDGVVAGDGVGGGCWLLCVGCWLIVVVQDSAQTLKPPVWSISSTRLWPNFKAPCLVNFKHKTLAKF